MNEARQEKAIETLKDWSKWLLGLDFAAIVGCVVILDNAAGSFAVTPFLVAAIVFFAISIAFSVFLPRELARVAEVLPLRDPDGNFVSVFQHKVTTGLSIGAIARLQLLSLGAGAFFFLVWVIARAVAGGS
ncbi:MAG: hypothetical protein WD533_02900 [Dehalococcoidia bacterium]